MNLLSEKAKKISTGCRLRTPIGASRSDAAPSFPPSRGWRFSNDIFGPGRLSSILLGVCFRTPIRISLGAPTPIELSSRSRLAVF